MAPTARDGGRELSATSKRSRKSKMLAISRYEAYEPYSCVVFCREIVVKESLAYHLLLLGRMPTVRNGRIKTGVGFL